MSMEQDAVVPVYAARCGYDVAFEHCVAVRYGVVDRDCVGA